MAEQISKWLQPKKYMNKYILVHDPEVSKGMILMPIQYYVRVKEFHKSNEETLFSRLLLKDLNIPVSGAPESKSLMYLHKRLL